MHPDQKAFLPFLQACEAVCHCLKSRLKIESYGFRLFRVIVSSPAQAALQTRLSFREQACWWLYHAATAALPLLPSKPLLELRGSLNPAPAPGAAVEISITEVETSPTEEPEERTCAL